MLDIDTAIKHCLEVAERYETRAKIIDRRKLGFALENPTACHECAAEHRQLAEWLTDYKELKTKYNDVQEKIRKIRGYLEFAEEHMNVMGVLEALDIIKELMKP